jgi:hypothetical protein
MKYLKMLLLLALAPSFAHAATLSDTATRLVQPNDNLQAADITIPGELSKRFSGAPTTSAAASKAQAAGDQ